MVSVSCLCHSYPLNAQVDLHILTLIMTMKSISYPGLVAGGDTITSHTKP